MQALSTATTVLADQEVHTQGFLPVHRRIDCEEEWRQVSLLFGRQPRPLGSKNDGLLPQGWERCGDRSIALP